jgi:hypothetical protein
MGYMRLPVLKTAEIWLWKRDWGWWVTIGVTTDQATTRFHQGLLAWEAVGARIVSAWRR